MAAESGRAGLLRNRTARRKGGLDSEKMLFKVALAIAVCSLGALALSRRRNEEDEAVLEREIEARLETLRESLFRR
jgi:hypothetical protein